MNEVRPASAAECTEADILTAVQFGANFDATFHQRAKLWDALATAFGAWPVLSTLGRAFP